MREAADGMADVTSSSTRTFQSTPPDPGSTVVPVSSQSFWKKLHIGILWHGSHREWLGGAEGTLETCASSGRK